MAVLDAAFPWLRCAGRVPKVVSMMKTLRQSGILPLIILSSALWQNPAEAGWWDKAKALLKSEEAAEVTPAISTEEMGMAFKQALQIGADTVISQLGGSGGFNEDPAIHIPLPEQLESVKAMLEKFGMGGIVESLELKLNEAAETATPQAKALFRNAINEMTFDDVKKIYTGSKDSATRYFRQKMSPELINELQPIIESSLDQVGAIRMFDEMMLNYNELPFVPQANADIDAYVMEKTLDGIFLYLAQQEAAIRDDPLRQSTELLKRVFGGN